jgi:peptidoglycan/LPS O-acetylase OafA/YrhL
MATRRLPELDGIRGLAILLVLVYHVTRLYFPADGPIWIRQLLLFGWCGVDLFFVLSGFLIGGILLDTRRSPTAVKTFYGRRVCRIVPLYFVVVIAMAIGDRLAPSTLTVNRDVPWIAYGLYLQNVWMALHGHFGMQGLAVTWSLALEEQFYLFLPLALRLFPPSFIPALIAPVMVGAVAFRLLAMFWHDASSAYVLLPARADALMLGVLGAWLVRQPHWRARLRVAPLGWAALAGTVGTILLALHAPNPFHPQNVTVGYTWIGMTAVTVILLTVTQHDHRVSRLFRAGWLGHWGIIAYGVYLFHWPIMWLLHESGMRPRSLQPVLAIATTYALARLSWQWLEQPLIAWGHRTFRYALR